MSDLRAIAIVVRERSGSTVFQRFLGTYPGHKTIGEIWNYGIRNNPFYDFWAARVAKEADFIRPHRRADLFRAYLEAESEGGVHTVVFDQKYGHLDQLSSALAPDFDAAGCARVPRPTVLRFLAENRIPTIHLVRRNKLRVFVSLRRAQTQGIWHVRDRVAEAGDPVPINPEKAFAFVDYEVRFDAMVAEFLANHHRVMTLDYEALFTTDYTRIRPEQVSSIAGFLELDPELFDPSLSLQRTNPFPLSALVSDFEALARRFVGTPHAWMLDG